jgi:hypothetical protein
MCDTYEIDLAKVGFLNPEWNKFVEELMVRTLYPELGAGPYEYPSRCKLHKLLLYQTGSQ